MGQSAVFKFSAVSLGQIRSLIEHPASMTHATIPPDAGALEAAPPDLLAMDEAHHASATTWRKVAEWAKSGYTVGLTAISRQTSRLSSTVMPTFFLL